MPANEQQQILNLAWSFAQHSAGSTKAAVDNKSLNLVCELLLTAIKSGQPCSGDLAHWSERILKCPRTAGILLAGLSQIVGNNYKTHEQRFKQLISTLVVRYEELFKNIREDVEGMMGEGDDDDDDEEEDDEEVTARAKRRKQLATNKRKNTAALEPPAAPSLLAIMPSPEIQIRRPTREVTKLTQDMSWLNDPQYIMDITAVDSMIVEQFSQRSASGSRQKSGGLESTFKNLLGSIAENEPFVIEEPDETFFHFNEELSRGTGGGISHLHREDEPMPEAKTPAGANMPFSQQRVEEIHLHEKSVSRSMVIGINDPEMPNVELPTKKKRTHNPTGISRIQKATSDTETSVEPLTHVPAFSPGQANIGQNVLFKTPSFWQFACEFMSSGQNIVQTFVIRDRIASGLNATDWDVPAPPPADDEITVGRESVFSFAPETDRPAPAAVTPQPPVQRTSTALNDGELSIQQRDSDIMTLAQTSLSVQSAVGGANTRAQALKIVLDKIFHRSRDPVPWTCVLPPSALRWQAAVCLGAILHLLAQNLVSAHQASPFGSLQIGPAQLKRALEDDRVVDKENKKPRRIVS